MYANARCKVGVVLRCREAGEVGSMAGGSELHRRRRKRRAQAQAVGKVPTVAAMGSRAPKGAATKHTEQSTHRSYVHYTPSQGSANRSASEGVLGAVARPASVSPLFFKLRALRPPCAQPAGHAGGRRGTTGGRRPRRGGRADATERRGGKAGAGGNGNKRQRPNPRPDLKRAGREADERETNRAGSSTS